MKKKLLITFLVLSFAQNSFSEISDKVALKAYEILRNTCFVVFHNQFDQFQKELKYKDDETIKAELAKLSETAVKDLYSPAFKDVQVNFIKGYFKDKSFDDFDQKFIINLATDLINDLNCRKLLVIYDDIRKLNKLKIIEEKLTSRL